MSGRRRRDFAGGRRISFCTSAGRVDCDELTELYVVDSAASATRGHHSCEVGPGATATAERSPWHITSQPRHGSRAALDDLSYANTAIKVALLIYILT